MITILKVMGSTKEILNFSSFHRVTDGSDSKCTIKDKRKCKLLHCINTSAFEFIRFLKPSFETNQNFWCHFYYSI